MADTADKKEKKFSEAVDIREKRKLRARRKKEHPLWFGLGMFGLVGWSVAIPMVVCIFIGIWMDSRYPGQSIQESGCLVHTLPADGICAG